MTAPGDAGLLAPCSGLVVEVPTRGQSLLGDARDRVLLRMQSSASGAIVELAASSLPGCDGVVSSVYVQVGDYVRAGELLAVVGPALTERPRRLPSLARWRRPGRIAGS